MNKVYIVIAEGVVESVYTDLTDVEFIDVDLDWKELPATLLTKSLVQPL